MAIGRFIAERLAARGWSQRSLAGRLGHQGPGLVSNVIKGKGRVPPAEAPAWADALDLKGEERDRFLAEALGESPMLDELKRLRQEAAEDQRLIAELTRRLEALERKDAKKR